jgi:DNA polymerase I
MLVDALNSHFSLQRYKVFFVGGNYSRILSKLDLDLTELDVRRAFTSFQLMTILEEDHHSLLIVENDQMFYEDADGSIQDPTLITSDRGISGNKTN